MGRRHIALLPYPPDIPPAALCDRCRGEIYPGELCHRIDGFFICADCFLDFAFDYFAGCLVLAGEEKETDRTYDTD